jgi:pilus assembly protein CpaF
MAGHDNAEQIVEREVRELVRRRGLDPTDDDAAAVRHLIDEVVADYQERSLTANLPLLIDLAQVAKSVADRVVGVGPLQPFIDDPLRAAASGMPHVRVDEDPLSTYTSRSDG